MDSCELNEGPSLYDEGTKLVDNASRISHLACEIVRFGNELDIVSILDECTRLTQEKRRLQLEVARLEKKVKESQFDLNGHRRRISELNDELIVTKQEAGDWKTRCELNQRRYESLNRMVALASHTLASPSSSLMPAKDMINELPRDRNIAPRVAEANNLQTEAIEPDGETQKTESRHEVRNHKEETSVTSRRSSHSQRSGKHAASSVSIPDASSSHRLWSVPSSDGSSKSTISVTSVSRKVKRSKKTTKSTKSKDGSEK